MESYRSLERRYLELLAKNYPNRHAVYTEIINLQAILNLPKGTEHFISDVHGEYEAFYHILNNCSGVIREKLDILFPNMEVNEKNELCTLIYYPTEILKKYQESGIAGHDFYIKLLKQLITIAKFLSSKYTRSKVRKAVAQDYSYIIDELLHAQPDEEDHRLEYHKQILESIIETGAGHHFAKSLCSLIKRLAVDHLHIVGDIFDRGAHPDKIMDLLLNYHSIDIQWGNHDILWMGAASGSTLCMATVVRNNVVYDNYELLENGYGISMRKLAIFAQKTYTDESEINLSPIKKAISVIMFKLQGQAILRHPEFDMENSLFLDKLNLQKKVVEVNGYSYQLKTIDFPTVDVNDPYALNQAEQEIVDGFCSDFLGSQRLQQHIRFLYANGSMYKCYNGNLLFHGCIPLNIKGEFFEIIRNGMALKGKEYLDFADLQVRRAYDNRDQDSLDHMWYFWCGNKSPLSGREMKPFERTYFLDPKSYFEPRDPYYSYYHDEQVCKMILEEFGLNSETGHIINGHTPIKVKVGEKPVSANGKLIVIDGGFCTAYHHTTGIAGYTLIYNSHGMRLKAHNPFTTIEDAINNKNDIVSDSHVIEVARKRVMVSDTDAGFEIKQLIVQLKKLLDAYRSGAIKENISSGKIRI